MISMISNDLNTCSSLRNVIEHLDGVKERVSSDKDFLDEVSEKLERKFDDNTNVNFLSEQLRLIFKHPNARRYSPSLLAMAMLLHRMTPICYKKIYADDFLTLPSPGHLLDTLTLSESTAVYIKARFNKLDDRERLIAILMDEVYSQQKGQYANGNFYGMESGNITIILS